MCSAWPAIPAASTALPGSPSSVTIPLCTVTVSRAGSVKNPSAIRSWVISRRISSSLAEDAQHVGPADDAFQPPVPVDDREPLEPVRVHHAGRGLYQVVRAYRHRRVGHQVARGGLVVRAVPAVLAPGRQREQVGLGYDADHRAVLGGDRETADLVLAEDGGDLAVRGVRTDRHHAGGHDVPDVGVHGDHFLAEGCRCLAFMASASLLSRTARKRRTSLHPVPKVPHLRPWPAFPARGFLQVATSRRRTRWRR